MTRYRLVAVPTAIAALALLGCPSGEPTGAASTPAAAVDAGDAEVVARVNGEPITGEELDEFIKDDLFRSRASTPSRLYDLRDQYLDELVRRRAIETEAAKRGVTPERLLEQEVAALGPVSDAEIETWYGENKERLGGADLESIRERIREFLGSQRAGQAGESLVQQASVERLMDAPRMQVSAEGPSKGPADAPVTIVEFSDFQCPFCQRVLPTLDRILEKYPQDVRLVYRHLPLANHSRARQAAEASMCAMDQDQFWAYHDKLFENTQALGDEDLLRYAKELGLDEARFAKCYEDGEFADEVQADFRDAGRAGISGTPAFVVNGVLISGAKPAEEFFRVIDRELKRLEQQQSS